ncbi:MAG: LamG domain-containing protein, partial [Phycisphaerae bacterium]
MCRKLIYLFSFVLVLSIAGNVSAELVGYWKFDEGSGTIAYDSSGNGLDGTLNGDPQWVAGQLGGALDFDGNGDFVEVPHSPLLSITDEITIAAWTYMRANASGEMAIVSKGGWAANDLPYELTETPGGVIFWQFYDDGGRDTCAPDSPPVDEWHHIAGTYDGTIFKCYIDGELADEWAYAGTMPENTASVNIGQRTRGGCLFNGIIDEVAIYNRALSEDEIPHIMMGIGGFGQASAPNPADGALLEDTWVNLAWRPGDFAVSHDVYLGENFDDVNDGAEGTFQGNQIPTFFVVGFPGFPYPDGLIPGTTYYWRIDEVNDTDPNSPWKGDVWSFMVPPKTAYAPDPADAAEQVDPDADLSWTAGFGAKLHTVYFGDNFDDVNNATGGLPQGATTYDPGTLELAKTYYWRVDEFDAIETYKGHVWSFTTQGAVGSPNPANGAVDVKQTQIITWSPSVYAASHQLYFGTDKDAVKNADT